MRRSRIERVSDILEHIDKILESTKDTTFHQFQDDWILQAAIERFIEIIGEAAKYVPEHIKSTYKDIPWREMAGMRDIVAHDYDEIDLREVWNIIKKDIPKLKKQIEQIQIPQ